MVPWWQQVLPQAPQTAGLLRRVAAQTGLGALIWRSRNYGRTEWVFVSIAVLGATERAGTVRLEVLPDRATHWDGVRTGTTRL